MENKSAVAGSACYLNRQEPLELAFGYGKAAEELVRVFLHSLNTTDSGILAACVAPPIHEYVFPRDL